MHTTPVVVSFNQCSAYVNFTVDSCYFYKELDQVFKKTANFAGKCNETSLLYKCTLERKKEKKEYLFIFHNAHT